MMSCGKVDVVHVRVDFFPRKKEMDQSRIYLKKKSVSDSGYLRVLRGGGLTVYNSHRSKVFTAEQQRLCLCLKASLPLYPPSKETKPAAALVA